MNIDVRPRMSFEEMIDDALEANAKDVPGRQLTYACIEECNRAVVEWRKKMVTREMGS